MLLQDEVVAARRLQAVINSDILNFVTEHIKDNNPQNSTSYDFYGNYMSSRLKRKEYDAEYKEIPGSIPVRPILQCTLNQLPLRFVNSNDNYEDATNKFRSLLSMQNKFGTPENGFSLPSKLFDHKDQKYKLDNYQFDLKNDDRYFYVILREVGFAHFAILEKLVYALISRVLKILVKYIVKICSSDSKLLLIHICSIRILIILEVITKTSFSKI